MTNYVQHINKPAKVANVFFFFLPVESILYFTITFFTVIKYVLNL